MIIGLTGYAQSGKDTVAQELVERYGFTRVAFADKIREFLYDVNPMVACSPTGYLVDLVNLVGWDKAKKEAQVRSLLQNLGVAARKNFGENFWILEAFKDIKSADQIVVTDVRFINEAKWIKSYENSHIWKVKRPDITAVNDHVSESEMDGYKPDQIFYNNGTLDDLKLLVKTRMLGYEL